MAVIISKNLHKTSEQIDINGNVVVPFTKQIIKPVEKEYVPTPEQLAGTQPQTPQSPTTQLNLQDDKSPISDKINALVEAKIKEKIDKIVEQRVNEALKNI
jgi:hypothetical protein